MNAIILISVLMILMALRVPVVFSLLLSCLFYVTFLKEIPMIILAHRMLGSLQIFPLLSLPLYILAADIMNSGRITEEMFNLSRSLVGHIRGSMGHVNVVASMIFAGMSGSITADTAGLGKIEIPMMTKAGYDKSFAVAVTGASSIIGPIMPPSIQMILYAMIAEQSVGRLFVGGAIPGMVMGLAIMVTIYFYAVRRKYPYDANRAPWAEIWKSFRRSVWALMTPVIILGGIVTGIFTPTEAAVVAVVYAFVISFFVYRTLQLKDMLKMMVGSAVTSALILVIMGAASVFGWIVTMENIPALIRDFIMATTDQQWVVLIILNLVFLVAGCFFDICAIILVFTPMILPVLTAFQIDLVHWGVVEVLNVCIGFLTPPFGVGLYVLSDLSGLSVSQVMKAVTPFLIPLLISLTLITFFPQLVLWLPEIVFG
ncbi:MULTISPECIES: TRAP transporter large permease [Desulfotignum]|jgi:tripartite ATP-independent transporter DctM subunit|uniref:TRAP-type C4-dicarboxylate permease, large subunit DctM n=2 Tax=Desulfotignum TaxID=115780 RepID=S0G2W0_9BACT|nr:MULTISPECIES: TRAP transporter large permease [Desulfotignum]EMS78507.1 TRAP-type C4-dicarboxylate permease, large subunit DctM [Desulfotignum phosphitoxidans DSM 13687]EMS80190.1 TRAP-type C4-dicarboxylate permease, large subunit DctM [Desulfotignum phosphitoxidans DSM 13687]